MSLFEFRLETETFYCVSTF